MVDRLVLGANDLVVIEVDLVEDGLVEVAAGGVGGGEVLLVSVVEYGQAVVQSGIQLVLGGL